MNTRKIGSLLIAVVMLIAVQAGCISALGTTASAASAEKLLVRFVIPGDPADGEAIVDKAINDKLEKDGYNLTYLLLLRTSQNSIKKMRGRVAK